MASHFTFENIVSELVRMDAPINKGPPMRWRRKQSAAGDKLGTPTKQSLSRTPGRTPNRSGGLTEKQRTPCAFKTPGKTPSKTPGKSAGEKTYGRWKTPSKSTSSPPNPPRVQDRFIPSRHASDMDMGHFCPDAGPGNDDESSQAAYRNKLGDALNVGPTDKKILCYNEYKPKPQEGHMNNLRVIYTTNKSKVVPKAQTAHVIPKIAERVLDAPNLIDDYYLNLLDWSTNNHLAVALGHEVYIWNASSGTIVQLMSMEADDHYVSSLKWLEEGNILAVGTWDGNVELWDAGEQKRIRTMTGHSARVAALSWCSYICSSGSRTGNIHHHDVRVPEHHVATLANHTQEVCGLQWSPDRRYLASGGNDNVLNIWDSSFGFDNRPLHTLTHHQAAVKALAWCPWQPTLLASGGGTADRHIRLWNVTNGSSVMAVDTQSQVCGILWSSEYKEMVSGHGFSRNQLSLWKYPSMNKLGDMTGHSARTLCLTMSPDGASVASAAADQTIRIWKCFPKDAKKKSVSVKQGTSESTLLKSTCIR